MLRMSDATITNSVAGKKYLISVLKAHEDSVFVKPYEVPAVEELLGDFRNANLFPSGIKHPVFLFVGHIVPRKGLRFLLEACILLRERGYSEYTLLIVGDGPQQAELQSFCKAHKIDENIRWVGRVDYKSLGSYFHEADAFVLPTLEDTWGVVVHESMVMGIPVLCSKLAGAQELIAEGENGYCFDPYNVESIVSSMLRFIENPNLSKAMQEKTRETVAEYTPQEAACFLSKVTEYVVDR